MARQPSRNSRPAPHRLTTSNRFCNHFWDLHHSFSCAIERLPDGMAWRGVASQQRALCAPLSFRYRAQRNAEGEGRVLHTPATQTFAPCTTILMGLLLCGLAQSMQSRLLHSDVRGKIFRNHCCIVVTAVVAAAAAAIVVVVVAAASAAGAAAAVAVVVAVAVVIVLLVLLVAVQIQGDP